MNFKNRNGVGWVLEIIKSGQARFGYKIEIPCPDVYYIYEKCHYIKMFLGALSYFLVYVYYKFLLDV